MNNEPLVKRMIHNYFNFEDFYARLIKYKEQYGNCNIPQKYENDEYKLGLKVSSIRNKNVKLSDEQIKRLNDIGFVWSKPKAFDFEEFMQYLTQYKEKYGDCDIIQTYEINGYKLGQKISSIRSKNIKLSDEQINRLNCAGFIWDATRIFDFELFVKHLSEYKKQFGDCDVASKYQIDGYLLGSKVQNIRTGNLKITTKQINRLNKMGFLWKAKSNSFDIIIEHLKAYKAEFGNCNVPTRYEIDGYKLGNRIKNLKANKYKLTEDQINLLEELGLKLNLKTLKADTYQNL